MELFSHTFLDIEYKFFWLEIFFGIESKSAHALDRKNYVQSKIFLTFFLKCPYNTNSTLRILHRDITLKHRKILLIHSPYISTRIYFP